MEQGQEKYWRGLKQKRRVVRAPHILMILLICSILLQFFPLKTTEANSIETVCGKEEHYHTANCYNEGWRAKESGPCGYIGDQIYQNPVRDNNGNIVHIHTSECFRYLSCGNPNHEHTDACYTQLTLNCPKEEHAHDDSCYQFVETKRDSSADARSSTDSTIANTVEGMTPNNTVINLFDYWTIGTSSTVDSGWSFYGENPEYYFDRKLQ